MVSSQILILSGVKFGIFAFTNTKNRSFIWIRSILTIVYINKGNHSFILLAWLWFLYKVKKLLEIIEMFLLISHNLTCCSRPFTIFIPQICNFIQTVNVDLCSINLWIIWKYDEIIDLFIFKITNCYLKRI